jgi:transposase
MSPGYWSALRNFGRRRGKVFPFVVIQETALDGFWIDRVLQNEGIESHIVDPASIATSHRRRRAKTDRIDGEALVRALLAYKRGEPGAGANTRRVRGALGALFGSAGQGHRELVEGSTTFKNCAPG